MMQKVPRWYECKTEFSIKPHTYQVVVLNTQPLQHGQISNAFWYSSGYVIVR